MTLITKKSIFNAQYGLDCAAMSDVGCIREHNEDCFGIYLDNFLFCLADGVGGLEFGEIASKIAIEVMGNGNSAMSWRSFLHKISGWNPEVKARIAIDTMSHGIQHANEAIFQKAEEQKKKMATTIVAMQLVQKNQLIVGYIGDSRAYLFRNNMLGQITIDHTVAMSLLQAGASLPSNGDVAHHTITKALGSIHIAEPDIQRLFFQKDDFFLLCSDGLTDMLNDTLMAKLIFRYQENVEAVIQQLIELAKEKGGRDNITAIGVRIVQNSGL